MLRSLSLGLGLSSSNSPNTSSHSSSVEEEMENSDFVPSYDTAADVDLAEFGKESVRILLNRDSGKDNVTSWKVSSDSNGGVIWRGEVLHHDWNPFRVKRTIPTDKFTIQKSLVDKHSLMQLDDMMQEVDILRSTDDGLISIRHIRCKAVFPTAPREFIVITSATTLEDGRVVIASRSVLLKDVPVPEGYVRGTNIISGYIVEETKDQDGNVVCDVRLVAHADLGGSIPATIINMIGTSATMKILIALNQMVQSNQ